MELVTITLDKERHLRLTMKGMVAFERQTGKNLLKGFDFNDMSLEDTAALIWACMVHEDKELTCDDVMSMIDLQDMTTVLEALTVCLSNSLPEAKEAAPLVVKSQTG